MSMTVGAGVSRMVGKVRSIIAMVACKRMAGLAYAVIVTVPVLVGIGKGVERRLARAGAPAFKDDVPGPAVDGNYLCESRGILPGAYKLDVAAPAPVSQIVMGIMALPARDAEGRVIALGFVVVHVRLERRDAAGPMAREAEGLHLGVVQQRETRSTVHVMTEVALMAGKERLSA